MKKSPCGNCSGPNDGKQADPFLCLSCQELPFLVSYADKTVRPTGVRVASMKEVEEKRRGRAVDCVYTVRVNNGVEECRVLGKMTRKEAEQLGWEIKKRVDRHDYCTDGNVVCNRSRLVTTWRATRESPWGYVRGKTLREVLSKIVVEYCEE